MILFPPGIITEVAVRLESVRSYRGATLGRRQIYFDPPEVKKFAPGALGAGNLISLSQLHVNFM